MSPFETLKLARERVLIHLKQRRKCRTVYLDRHYEAAVEAGIAGMESIQSVNGREAGRWF